MSRVPGAEWIVNARNAGGTYATGYPWRLVLHTTEVVPSSLHGARTMAARHEFPPHLWAWPERDWLAQTVPLDRSAFALKQPKGAPPTNKARAIQVEIVGHADQTPKWPAGWWDWIGRRIVRPVIDLGYPIQLDEIAATTGRDGYGTGGRVRMTWTAWAHFGGIAGHANVPGNSHWDIGAGDLARVAAAASDQSPTPEDPMATSPAVVAVGANLQRLLHGNDVALGEPYGKLWEKRDDAGWLRFDGSTPTRPDSALAPDSSPCLGLDPQGRPVAGVHGIDGRLYSTTRQTNGNWSGFVGFNGQGGRPDTALAPGSSPSLTYRSGLAVFTTTGTDLKIWELRQQANGTWTKHAIGGVVAS